MEALVHYIDGQFLGETKHDSENRRFVHRYFLTCLAVIAAISVYDAYLVVVYKCYILELEQNPICLKLIELDPGGLTYFLIGKALGTLCVITALTTLYLDKRKHWLAVSNSVTAFQIGLLAFLTFK